MKKLDFSNYTIKKSKKNERNITNWQEYAVQICKDFNLTGEYKAMIFRYAKKNLSYLQGRVMNTREKFREKLGNKGNYLISLFRKKKPWEK